MHQALSRIVALTTIGSVLAYASSSGAVASQTHRAKTASRMPASIAAWNAGLRQETFARGNSKLFNPDALVVTKHYVFVVYQNASDTTSAPSTLVQYSRSGTFLRSVNLNGRCDGMRLNPYTHTLWALVNNDGLNGSSPRQPALYVVSPRTLEAKLYRFSLMQQPHGGGYDDLAFIDGRAFFSASSPTLNAAGVNDKPIAVEAKLDGSQVDVRPILYGNAYGYDLVARKVTQLNITDPDSLAVDTRHDLVIVSEGDAQMVFVANPGERDQTVTRIPTGTQLDDTVFTTGTHGSFYICDSTLNVVYRVDATYARGSVFSEAALGAPVSSFVGALDPLTGILTPLLTVRDGILDPTTLVFTVPGSEDDD